MEQAESKKVSELLEELVLVCKDNSQTAALFHENLQELWPSLQGASSHSLPKVLIPLHNLHLLEYFYAVLYLIGVLEGFVYVASVDCETSS